MVCEWQSGIHARELQYHFKYSYNSRPPKSLEPLRSIGDINCRCQNPITRSVTDIIRKPELYVWKLSSDQIKRATLFLTCDGYDDHTSLVADKFATFVCDPIMCLSNCSELIRGTFMEKYFDVSMLSQLVPIHDQINYMTNVLKQILDHNDMQWITTVDDAHRQLNQLVKSINNNDNIVTNPSTIIKMAGYLALLLCSSDNITTIAYNLPWHCPHDRVTK